MGNWWPAKGRGLIFGLWTCHQYIGDIVAALAAGYLLHSGFDYRWYLLLLLIISSHHKKIFTINFDCCNLILLHHLALLSFFLAISCMFRLCIQALIRNLFYSGA
jgi:hypothetical protein